MKFCPDCAASLTFAVPKGDNRHRYICNQCGAIHYQNPRMIVGSIPAIEHNGRTSVLLCRRAIEPRYGYWTLPAGFMENGETTSEAAMRETLEEAGATIVILGLHSFMNIAAINQVHLFYNATLTSLDYAAGEESLEVKLFHEEDIPWDDLAFPTIRYALKFFFADLARGADFQGPQPIHSIDIHKNPL